MCESSEIRQASAQVTPEMTKAGTAELFFYERGSDDSAEFVAAIYGAMEACTESQI